MVVVWNVLDRQLWSTQGFVSSRGSVPAIEHLSRAMWEDLYKLPADSRPKWFHNSGQDLLADIRSRFFAAPWFEVYDFIQFMVEHTSAF